MTSTSTAHRLTPTLTLTLTLTLALALAPALALTLPLPPTRYCCPDSTGYLVPIAADGARSAEYVAACNLQLPEIERLGRLTGNNSSKQMSFFCYDADPDAENDLALAIQVSRNP